MIGSITFLVAATGAFLELQVALNTIWRVKVKEGVNLRAFVLDRLRSLGAAGSMMVLLLWVHYLCQILLFGAEFTRVYSARRGVKPKPESFAEKDPDAVKGA